MGTNIHRVRMQTISPGTVTGHASAGGFNPSDVEFINREVRDFLTGSTDSRP
jgi:homoserine O-acetyltransferase